MKFSILCMYLRIFPSRGFRTVVYVTIALLMTCFIILVFLDIFQCVPVQAIWDRDIKDARCLSISNVAFASAGVNIATEIVILVLPIPVLRSLHLAGRKKVALYALFGAGIW